MVLNQFPIPSEATGERLYSTNTDLTLISEKYIYAVFWSWYKEMSITPFCEMRPFELLGGKISRIE